VVISSSPFIFRIWLSALEPVGNAANAAVESVEAPNWRREIWLALALIAPGLRSPVQVWVSALFID
jgi:hypothetical protein